MLRLLSHGVEIHFRFAAGSVGGVEGAEPAVGERVPEDGLEAEPARLPLPGARFVLERLDAGLVAADGPELQGQ